MKTHDDLIKEIALEMQKSNGQLMPTSHNLDAVYIPAARIAVKHMAEKFEHGYQVGAQNDNSDLEFWEEEGVPRMISDGLIDPNDQLD